MKDRRVGYLALFVAAGVLIGGTVSFALRDGDTAGGSTPALDVTQIATSSSHGVTLSLTRAAFSGTATFIEARVEIDGNDPASPQGVTRVAITPDGLAGSDLQPARGGSGVSLAVGEASVIRLTPVDLDRTATVRISSLDLVRGDGSRTTVEGDWDLALDVPVDITSRLRLEQLTAAPADSGGVRVSIEGATRSSTETLLTVRVDSASPLSHLGEPWLFAEGKRLYGGRIGSSEDGSLVTYSFPMTEFGSQVEARFGPFVRKVSEAAGSVRLDLSAVMTRHQLSGANQESAPISVSDNVERTGFALTATKLTFTTESGSSRFPGRNRAIIVTFQGALPDSDAWTAVTSEGEQLDLLSIGVGYSKDATGVISSPRTEVTFLYDDLDRLEGPLTVTYVGAPDEVIRGDWILELEPE